jgi:UTP--glucose-1-phosphate uridylyltransferase
MLTPTVMEILGELESKTGSDGKIQLSAALAKLHERERYLALQVQGHRYDMGGKYGLLFAQLALALDGTEREEVLAQLVELLAARRATPM